MIYDLDWTLAANMDLGSNRNPIYGSDFCHLAHQLVKLNHLPLKKDDSMAIDPAPTIPSHLKENEDNMHQKFLSAEKSFHGFDLGLLVG